MACQSRSTSKRLKRVDQGDPVPVFPGFTVTQLNRHKEHPRGKELSLEKKERNNFLWRALEWLAKEVNISQSNIFHTAFVINVNQFDHPS